MTDLPERAARRNMLLLISDNVCFGVALAFLGPTTILPAFIRRLGGSPMAVGILGAIVSGGFFLPQLFASRFVANRPLVKPFVVVPLIFSRSFLLLLVPGLRFLAPRSETLALVSLLLGYAAFTVTDSLSGVGWFDMLSKSIPLKRRGRVMGTAQTISGILAIGAGMIVSAVLARKGSYLANHLLLIAVGGAFCCMNPILLSQIREPRGTVSGNPQPAWRDYLPRLAVILRRDGRFAWLTATRWLSGLADMASAFYVLYATGRMGMAEETVGLFVSAGVVGGLLCGLLLGPLGDHKGSVQVIRVVMVLRILCPTLALVSPLLAGVHGSLAVLAFLIIYTAAGMANGAWFVGFMNYILEIAPPPERAMYVGLANTLGGLLLIGPLVAGWLVQVLSYEALFAVVLVLATLGLITALRGPAPAMKPAPLHNL